MKLFTKVLRASIIAAPILLVACGGNDDGGEPTPTPMAVAEFEITVVNTTNNQPLSPVAVVLHDGSFSPWQIGAAASDGLEQLAESGSPTDFLAAADIAFDTVAGEEPVGPGGNVTLGVSAEEQEALYLSVASMLVNTNDAFTGSAAIGVGQLAVGEYVKLLAPIYDAGTEANDELAIYIPGPAGGGEGFNATREEQDIVTRHPGVVTQADGYEESALNESHRFDNGAMLITVVRTM